MASLPLREVQERFVRLILDPGGDPGRGLDVRLAGAPEALADRLGVYRRNVVGGLCDVLARTFPTVARLVGPAFFRTMAQTFVVGHPPDRGCLNLYGQAFPAFIGLYGPARDIACLHDVAVLDNAVNEAAYADDDAALQAQDLASLCPDSRLFLRASARLVDSPWPVRRIQAFCRSEQDADAVLDIGGGGEGVLVLRPVLEVELIPLTRAESAFLGALAAGRTLAEGAEAALSADSSFDLAETLGVHLERGSFRALGAG